MKNFGKTLMAVGLILMFIGSCAKGMEKEEQWYEENGYQQVYGSGE